MADALLHPEKKYNPATDTYEEVLVPGAGADPNMVASYENKTPFVKAQAGMRPEDVTTTDTMPIVTGVTSRHNVTVPPPYIPKTESIDIPQTPDVVNGPKAAPPAPEVGPKAAPNPGPVVNIDTPLGSTFTRQPTWKPSDIRFDGNVLRRILQTAESGARGYTGDKTETDRQRELREVASFKEITDRAAADAKARAQEYAEQEKARREGFAHERGMQKSELEGRKAIEDAQRKAAAGVTAGANVSMNPLTAKKRTLPNGVIVDSGMMAD